MYEKIFALLTILLDVYAPTIVLGHAERNFGAPKRCILREVNIDRIRAVFSNALCSAIQNITIRGVIDEIPSLFRSINTRIRSSKILEKDTGHTCTFSHSLSPTLSPHIIINKYTLCTTKSHKSICMKRKSGEIEKVQFWPIMLKFVVKY